MNLFNPPPLAQMNRMQKIGRVFLVTVTLLVNCILLAMAGALAIFLAEHGSEMFGNIPNLMAGLEIIFTSILVNAVCIVVLLKIRKADRKLISAAVP